MNIITYNMLVQISNDSISWDNKTSIIVAILSGLFMIAVAIIQHFGKKTKDSNSDTKKEDIFDNNVTNSSNNIIINGNNNAIVQPTAPGVEIQKHLSSNMLDYNSGVVNVLCSSCRQYEQYSNLFCIANETIKYINIIGSWNSGEDEYYSGSISVKTIYDEYVLPSNIVRAFSGPDNVFDNTQEAKVRLIDYSATLHGGKIPNHICFVMQKNTYRDFLICKDLMDKPLFNGCTLRETYFNTQQSLITTNLPNICGVGIYIITSDNKILVSQASKNVSVNAGKFVYSSSGTMNWAGGETTPFSDIIRECTEEIGYTPDIENLVLFSFGVDADLGYYQFSFFEKSTHTSMEIIRNAQMARDFSIEIDRIIPFEFNYKTIIDHFRAYPDLWDNTSKANLIILLTKAFGKKVVEQYMNPGYIINKKRDELKAEWKRRSQREGRLAVLSTRYPATRIDEISQNYFAHVRNFIDDDLSSMSVLEVGGGIGVFTKYFAERAAKVTCVDVSPEMIVRNKQYLGPELSQKVHYVECFFQDFVSSQKYDCIICSLVLIHNSSELTELTKNMRKYSDTIYLFEHIEDGALVSEYTTPRTREDYINLFPEYRVVKSDSHLLFTDNLAFIKLVRE